jgi:hypothetical protein
MAMSERRGRGGKHNDQESAAGAEASASGPDKPAESGAEEPLELSEGAAQLALEGDDPPLPWLQGDDDDSEFQGAGTGQTVGFVLLGLLAIGLIVGGILWAAYKPGDEVLVADGSTIEAPDQPYKQRPDDPGGKVFEGTGDTSFGISEGQKQPARLGEKAAPQPGFASLEKGEKPAAKGAAAAADKAAPADTSGVGVQVAAYSNEAQAEAGWARLSQQYAALADLKHRVVQGQADIGTVYRLQAVAADLAAAKALCQQLKAAGLNCQVKN